MKPAPDHHYQPPPREDVPTRWQALLFVLKASAFQFRRALGDLVGKRPRRLLQAVAAGVPVVASDACGLAGVAGVTTFATGDFNSFREAVMSALAQRELVSARGTGAERSR